ncbi:MAG TPA: class I SAM-dependent methyltransferase [Terrimicrobiaceae bacterium]|nr:class I SAM-dependent methyltransferase [Terrimicrobiaceae bacterium]
MNEKDKDAIIKRYQKRLHELGAVPGALGEPKCRQSFYYHHLLDFPEAEHLESLMDVGCGYGDLGRFLQTKGWRGRYVGVDIVPELIDEGRKRYPDFDLRCIDIEENPLVEKFDWAVAIGSLTGRVSELDYYDHLEKMIATMWRHVTKGISFNLFSPFVDFQSPVHYHPNIARVCEIVCLHTRRFVLRNDFMPYEYAIYMYRDDEIDRERSIFKERNGIFDALEVVKYGAKL